MPPRRKSKGKSAEGPATPKSSAKKAGPGSSKGVYSSGSSTRNTNKRVSYVEVGSSGEEYSSEEEEYTESRKGKANGSSSKRKRKSEDDDDEFEEDGTEVSEELDDEEEEDLSVDDSDGEDVRNRRNRLTPGGGKKKQKKDAGSSASSNQHGSASKNMAAKAKDSGQKRTVVQLARAPDEKLIPGRISKHLLNFLTDLQDPAKNDRDWFAQNDAVYRYVWKNFNDFVTALVPRLVEEVDETLPMLPAKDLVHRIYRDVRFSADKTPYKTGLSAVFSRGGRKGFFAGYYLEVRPGKTFLAAGRWAPIKEHLVIFREHLLKETEEGKRLKAILSEPEFVKTFGPAKPDGLGKGKKCNIFGSEDELKVAPKIEGVDKNHPQIAWLKLKSFYVEKTFDDKTVLSTNFVEELMRVMKIMAPLVEILNDIIHPPPTPPPSDSEDEDKSAAEEEGEEEA